MMRSLASKQDKIGYPLPINQCFQPLSKIAKLALEIVTTASPIKQVAAIQINARDRLSVVFQLPGNQPQRRSRKPLQEKKMAIAHC